MTEQNHFTPYKDVPPENFIKAVHLMLINLNHMVATLLESSVGDKNSTIIRDGVNQLTQETSLLLRASENVCPSPTSQTPITIKKSCTTSKHSTNADQKRYRYIKSLLILHEVEQQEIAKEAEASEALVSQVIRGHKKGVARSGKKIAKIKQILADKLGKPEEELFPRKAA